jgi:hypothetical protein
VHAVHGLKPGFGCKAATCWQQLESVHSQTGFEAASCHQVSEELCVTVQLLLT